MKTNFFGLFKREAKADPVVVLTARIEQARALHRQGNLADAGKLFREMLAGSPAESEVYYRFGNLLKDQGAYEDAVANYDRAIALKADHAHAYCNRAVVLGFMNRVTDALDSYDRAIAIDPADAIAQCNRAILLLGLGKKDAAIAGFEAAVAQDSTSYPAYFYLGALLQERKAWRASLEAYARAIAINPNDAAAFYNHGVVLNELTQWTAALSSFDRAIELKPDLILAYASRGEVLEKLNQLPQARKDFGQAIQLYDHAIALNDKDAGIYMKRALLRQKLGRNDDALADYNAAATLNPNDTEIWFNRGTVLKELDDLDSALESYERAIAAKPDNEGAYLNRGVTLQGLGRLEAAIASYQRSVVINPDLSESRYSLALALLAHGDYPAGWAGHEWRWRAKSGPVYREKRDFQEPIWLGQESLAGKTILLYAEQGLGDALQFCRYVESVSQLGPRVILEVPRPLVELCAGVSGASQVVAFGSRLPPFDFQCPLMSLPLALGTTLHNIPAAAGYLRCDDGRLTAWQQRLGTKTKPRIGLAWSGNRSAGTDLKRHFTLSSLIPFLSDEFQFFCLQTDVSKADQAMLDTTAGILQFPDSDLTFANTAALCACMDLVISVDTSIAHLSGALGMTTWVLLPYVSDWRWLTDRQDSPWYRSARLFRQQRAGDWNGVFERVSAELRIRFNQ